MVDEIQSEVVGGINIPDKAPVGKRMAAALIDLLIIPILIGVVAGLVLFAVPNIRRNIVLVIVNVAWVALRDIRGAGPGKKMVGIKVIDIDSGSILSVVQSFIRNILLIVPFVLVIGYLLETIMIFSSGDRYGDKWAKTRVVLAD